MFKVGDLVRLSPVLAREGEDNTPLGVVIGIYPESEGTHGGHSVDVFWFDVRQAYDGEDSRALVLLNES